MLLPTSIQKNYMLREKKKYLSSVGTKIIFKVNNCHRRFNFIS